jgi:hypothetical protein
MSLYRRHRIRRLARQSLGFAGQMNYTEGRDRSQLFHRPVGRFAKAGADCSQYSASLCHWVGVKDVTDLDFTGTLAQKGRQVAKPSRGTFVFFGAPPYVHMGVMVKPLLSRSWHVIGFGDQAGPEEATLSSMLMGFASEGHPGHVFRDLT